MVEPARARRCSKMLESGDDGLVLAHQAVHHQANR